MQNFTGVAMSELWGGGNLASQNQNMLSEEEQLQRKKKLMGAGQAGDFTDAMSMMFGNRLSPAGTPRT